ncbi:GNAT family N-acetyltransferase [Halovivax gelatinilyticus]|uniref:GNAT family N-acetyltransferase n=1 Tax=Halovivax gelatinilyticus TaxID=2961597 RepID=UPI0020CA78BE|nr:GNAT family N-acetyltransferase [Halovivax gelatinilyticus]
MELRRLPADEDAVRRFLEDLWMPYNRELETIVEGFALSDDADIGSEELDFQLGRLESDEFRTWIAVEGSDRGDAIAETDGEFVGFVATEVDACPSTFDRPDRLLICDIYVREEARGTGLANELVDRAKRRARECGCSELKLEVDVGNDRALAFYDALGFEPISHTMVADVE